MCNHHVRATVNVVIVNIYSRSIVLSIVYLPRFTTLTGQVKTGLFAVLVKIAAQAPLAITLLVIIVRSVRVEGELDNCEKLRRVERATGRCQYFIGGGLRETESEEGDDLLVRIGLVFFLELVTKQTLLFIRLTITGNDVQLPHKRSHHKTEFPMSGM